MLPIPHSVVKQTCAQKEREQNQGGTKKNKETKAETKQKMSKRLRSMILPGCSRRDLLLFIYILPSGLELTRNLLAKSNFDIFFIRIELNLHL